MTTVLFINYMEDMMTGCPVELLEKSFDGFNRNVRAIHVEWNGYDCIQDFYRFEGEGIEECVEKAKVFFSDRIRKMYEEEANGDIKQLERELERLKGETISEELMNLGTPWNGDEKSCQEVKVWYFKDEDIDVSCSEFSERTPDFVGAKVLNI